MITRVMFLHQTRRCTPRNSQGVVHYDHTSSIRNEIYSCAILNLSRSLSCLGSEVINIHGSNVPFKFNLSYSLDNSRVTSNKISKSLTKYKLLLCPHIITKKMINSHFYEKETVKKNMCGRFHPYTTYVSINNVSIKSFYHTRKANMCYFTLVDHKHKTFKYDVPNSHISFDNRNLGQVKVLFSTISPPCSGKEDMERKKSLSNLKLSSNSSIKSTHMDVETSSLKLPHKPLFSPSLPRSYSLLDAAPFTQIMTVVTVKKNVSYALSTLSSFLARIPSVLWFYTANPAEFKQKLFEIKEAVKREAHHYWMGTKLLFADIRTARQILGRTLNGIALTRRERKQLLRTVTDVFRLVPMSIFVLIPFMEFALPFALKLFPNMLPSTFQDSLKAEENMKRELKSRIAMAEFFQETLQDLAKEQKKAAANRKMAIKQDGSELSVAECTEALTTREETAASFLKFLEEARNGELFPPEVIISYSTFFKDELTLDNMPRMQLINMCRYMSIPPYGSDNLLRFQLRHRIRSLVEDDQRILWEGIDSLTKMELREACQERGMRSTGLSKGAYKRALQQWIDLSVNRNVPISLLIMSRIFFLHEKMSSRDSVNADDNKSVTGLADAISGLDKEVVNEVILNVATSEEKSSNPDVMKIKLEVLEQQNELIEEEKKEREAATALKAEKEKVVSEKTEKDFSCTNPGPESNLIEFDDTLNIGSQEKKDPSMIRNEDIVSEESVGLFKEVINESDVSPVVNVVNKCESELVSNPVTDDEKSVEDEQSLSTEEIDAISQLVSPDPVQSEREILQRIKAAMFEENIEDLDKIQSEFGVDQGSSDSFSLDETKSYEVTVSTSNFKKDENNLTFPHEKPPLSDETLVPSLKSDSTKEEMTINETETLNVGVITKGLAVEPTQNDSLHLDMERKIDGNEKAFIDDKLNKAIQRLKSKVESMVGKIEIQLSTVEAKIGDKLHYLDKDMDGILSREEMAVCLQSVLKRSLTFEEAMTITADMDENEDGLFSIEELLKWLETSKQVKLVKEGRDAEVDKIFSAKSDTMKQKKEENNISGTGISD